MRNIILALTLLASSAITALPADAATWTFTGKTLVVENPDTGEPEVYTVKFTYDDSIAPASVSNLTTISGPPTAYRLAVYNNITSFSVSGARFNLSFDSGAARTSTLDSSRLRDGNAGFFVGAGSDGTEPGYEIQFNYLFGVGTPLTAAMPTVLDQAAAYDSGFAILGYYLNDDDPDNAFVDQYEALSTRFASYSLTQDAAADVPEPASWAMMICGFGMIGGALRRTKRTIVVRFG